MYLYNLINLRNPLTNYPAVSYLWLDIQDGHESPGVYVPDGVQLGAVHVVLVCAVLQVLVAGDVPHHRLVRHKEIVLAVLLVMAGRPGCVWGGFNGRRLAGGGGGGGGWCRVRLISSISFIAISEIVGLSLSQPQNGV